MSDNSGLMLSHGESSHRIAGPFANDTEDVLKTTRRLSDSAWTELQKEGPFIAHKVVQQGVRVDNGDVFPWNDVADEPEFGDLLDELEVTLVSESGGMEARDTAFAQWE